LQLFTIFSLITNPAKLNALNTAEEVGVAIGKPDMPIGPEHCLEYCLDILLWLFDVSQIEKADHLTLLELLLDFVNKLFKNANTKMFEKFAVDSKQWEVLILRGFKFNY
jgi:hypothetical protein